VLTTYFLFFFNFVLCLVPDLPAEVVSVDQYKYYIITIKNISKYNERQIEIDARRKLSSYGYGKPKVFLHVINYMTYGVGPTQRFYQLYTLNNCLNNANYHAVYFEYI